jgi:hypothetical protein
MTRDEKFLKEKGKETDSQAKMNEKMLQAEQDERVYKKIKIKELI